MIKLFGFSLLRNGVKYDYSFKESLLSMAKVVDTVYLALDKGDDETTSELSQISNLKIIDSKWDMSLTKGLVLSVETNKALHALKKDHHENGEWGIYLQADEVLHEDDYELLRNDIAKAEAEGCDAVSFRYLHFWQTHHHLAIAKNWYPQEIRAVKLNSEVESYGDAQSFKNHAKIYYTEARIFHYGHVRDQSVYKNKMEDMSKLYDTDAKKSKYYNEKDRDKDYTDCILYFGSHPKIMKDRIIRMGDVWEIPQVKHVYIIGQKDKYSVDIITKINAELVEWITSKRQVKDPSAIIINLNTSFLDKIFTKNYVPYKMKSKSARNWTNDFYLVLKCSQVRVGFR